MATRTIELSGASAVPFSARTAIDRSNIDVVAQDLTLEAAPGETVSQRVAVTNGADFIPSDDPWACGLGSDRGVNVSLAATLVQPIGEVGRVETCLEANSVAVNTFTFDVPDEVGDYTISFTAQWADPPQLWGNVTETISVREGGGGGEFDPGAVSASCSLRSSEIDEGDIGIVDVTVTNSNDVAASTSVNIIANGSILSTEDFDVAANDSLSFQTSVRDLSAGSYGIEATASATAASLGGGGSAFGLSRTRPLAQCDTC